ncbi:MAG TPA: hypothetical protein VMR88_12500 [Candidatus Polarisedimenticolaceae bacterium]|nr:hypothetical protein [Candidatus Polarisedimenticolaceae bacterium]
MEVKRSHLLPTSPYDADEVPDKKNLPAVSREQEHEWRELLQKQLADHWLKLNYPEEIKPKNVILEKIRGSGGKVA